MSMTPRPKKPNMKIGTHRELVLYDCGTGGVYRVDWLGAFLGVVARPEAPLTRLRRFFVSSATSKRLGRVASA